MNLSVRPSVCTNAFGIIQQIRIVIGDEGGGGEGYGRVQSFLPLVLFI